MGDLYISMRQVADACGWDGTVGTQRARRWLRKAGAAIKVNERWFTTPRLLRETFPDVWQEMLARLTRQPSRDA